MMVADAAPEEIESWFLAHAAELADLSNDGQVLPPDLSASLEATLPGADKTSAGSVVDRASVDGPSPGESRRIADVILGQVAGTCFGRTPSLRLLEAAEAVVMSRAGWAAFSASAASAVGSSRPRLAALVWSLKGLIHAFSSDPRRVARTYGYNIGGMIERYRREPIIDDVWRGLGWSDLHLRHIPAFDVLRLSDPPLFLRLLDQFPHPEPGWHIVAYVAEYMGINDLLELLMLSPLCFDSSVWLPGVKTPFLILAEVETKLEALADLDRSGSDSLSEAVIRAASKAVQIVISRADGCGLGYAWLQRLVTGQSFGNRRRPVANGVPIGCRDRLLWELAAALSPRHDAENWIMNEREVFKRDRAVAAIAAAGLGETGRLDAAADTMRRALRLGLLATGQAAGFANSMSVERRIMAEIIGRHQAPAIWFNDLWRDLGPFRDRARHMTTPVNSHSSETTLVAVTWFLFGLDGIAVNSVAHRELWRSLRLAVSEATMTQLLSPYRESWTLRYGFLAAYLGHRLVTSADDESISDLNDLLGPFLVLDMRLAEVVATLIGIGVPPAMIATASGCPAQLLRLLRRLEVDQAWLEAKQKQPNGGMSPPSASLARATELIQHAVDTMP